MLATFTSTQAAWRLFPRNKHFASKFLPAAMNVGELLASSLSPEHATRQAAEHALESAARDSYVRIR